ncbi:cupin domain-containing protein [Mucilaginibacter sp. L3T2-6]|uniref:cupin domain-containing protein n=1 Tax=Mucilaginibacter sp. L3T2-6 TaxID=3062491 RepID=UPI00267497C4|nr:cupin domain-containing protein [Mucilaginibacter sp. L3T2-6]MDO3642244.1 cupin domain-containing protein [Mucilaginibacter sp. L3T2-6]MDV6214739.1 cupin domain-containing protein [Mucilaginibacter sp. L3T2-6]
MEIINFSYLIAPLSREDFFQNYWEKKFVHHIHNNPGYFNNVLTISDIDSFISQQNLIPDGIRLMNKGSNIPSAEWTKSDTLLDGTIKLVIDPEKLLRLFNRGATIIINSAEKSIFRLSEACRTLEQELKFRIQANIYITPPNSQGFALHYDPHDIFLMQIKGPKTWLIYDTGEDIPIKYRSFSKAPRLISQFDINTGDFLYIPRGTSHEAMSSEASTIHVNFSLKPVYGYHLIEELARIASEKEKFFRLTIPHGFSTITERNAYLATFKQKLNELIEHIEPEQLLEKKSNDFVKDQTLNFRGKLISLLQLESLDLETVVSRQAGFECIFKTVKGEFTIQFGRQKVIIPPFIEKDTLLQFEPFRVKQIKGLITDAGKLQLVHKLIEAGFLNIDDTQHD